MTKERSVTVYGKAQCVQCRMTRVDLTEVPAALECVAEDLGCS